MKQKDQNTAVLVFAEKASTACRKQIHPDERHNLLMHQKLLDHTLQSVKKSSLPVIWMHEELQQGQKFGSRLLNAMEQVFKKGYEQIIVVGSDTPELTTKHILSAQEKLKKSNLVLGPSTDGGIYLLAIRRSHFNFFRQMDIVWQEGKDFQEIICSWTQLGQSFLTIADLRDIDTSYDLVALINKLSHTGLYASLFRIFSSKLAFPYENISFLGTSAPDCLYLRAPPSL